LDEHAPDQLASLDADAHRLQDLSGPEEDTIICFLGSSGVGKSTLINAIVAGDRVLLPAGGIGPLTALATKVRYSDEAYFEARYQKPGHLQKLLFPLWTKVQREHKADAVDTAESETDTGEGDEPTRLDEFKKVALQLITGNQFSAEPLPYVLDALSVAMGAEPRFGHAVRPEHEAAVSRIREALSNAAADKAFRCEASEGARVFHEELRRHAAGFLSPIIAEIEVGWPAPVLQDGLVLVDLPGIGVAGDRYREVTQKYVREQARAVAVVVDRAGVSETLLDLLRTSGYWDRVVGAAYEPEADPCQLMLVVSKVDEVAIAEHQALMHLPKEERPTKAQLFARICTEMTEKIRLQTAEQLANIDRSDNQSVNEARDAAREHLLQTLSVHPVSAREYALAIAEDEDERPQVVRTPDQSRIPVLQEYISGVGERVRSQSESARREVKQRLLRGVTAQLQLIEAQWEGDERIAAEIDRIRGAMEAAMVPWREEFQNRRGAYRGYLQHTVPEVVEKLVLEAQVAAQQDVRRYLNRMRDYHWATLRAAVARGGTFYGSRHIDLPSDIGDRFQEPMAAVWGQKLLKDIRKHTRHYADDCERLVHVVCEWARDNGAAVSEDVIDAQESRIKDQASQLHQVGKEASDELRDVVRKELRKAIEGPIRRKCEKFVNEGNHIGPGVKNRILNLFSDLAEEATEAARKPAHKILSKRFEEVREQITESLKAWSDPLKDSADAIVSTSAQRQRRSDAQRRKRVLARVKELSEAAAELEAAS